MKTSTSDTIRQYQYLVPGLFSLLAAVLLITFSSVTPIIETKQEVPIITDKPVGNIVSGHIYKQEITLSKDYINGVELFFATWIRNNMNDNEVVLLNGDYKILFVEKVSSKKIKDNQFYPINFRKNIYVGRGQKIYLCIYSDNGDQNNNITVWVNSKSELGKLYKVDIVNNDIIDSIKDNGTLIEGSMILRTHESNSDSFMLFKSFAVNSGWHEKLNIYNALFGVLPHYFFISLFFFLFCFCLYKLVGPQSIYLIVFMVGIFSAFTIQAYSIIDEGAHFDYINSITDNHRLPTIFDKIDTAKLFGLGNYVRTDLIPQEINQYEAFQPPLYYFLCSSVSLLISVFTESLLARLFSLRILAVFLLLVSIYFLNKTYLILADKNVIKRNDFLFFCVSLLFIFSPVFIKVMIPLNNDHLLVPLFTIIIYLIVKYYFSADLNTGNILIMSIISGAIILTKLTALFVIVIPMILLLYKKEYKYILLFILIIVLMLSPWLIFNFLNYGAFTGAAEHIRIVRPILDPDNVKWTPLYIVRHLPTFIGSIWFLNSTSSSVLDNSMNYFFTALLVLSIIFPIYSILSSIKNNPKASSTDRDKVSFLFLISILLNTVLLVFLTLKNQHYSLYGRYMFMNLSCFIFLLYIFSQDFYNEKSRKLFIAFSLPVLFLFLFEIVQLV